MAIYYTLFVQSERGIYSRRQGVSFSFLHDPLATRVNVQSATLSAHIILLTCALRAHTRLLLTSSGAARYLR